ncbi:unnamed protein product [Rhodiola kirilowii]
MESNNHLVQSAATAIHLSPISFLEQAAARYGSAVSLVYGQDQFTWAETRQRCLKLASSLSRLNVSRGDFVVALVPNIPALYELHFAIPMTGAALSALNTRLDAPTLAVVLEQIEPKVIFVDYQSSEVLARALEILPKQLGKSSRLVVIQETNPLCYSKMSVNVLHYEDLVEMGQSEFEILHPGDEGEMISISYTSGSTGFPKGVMYSHKATYLNSLAQIERVNMKGQQPVFLWTVDMFRCNGWCFTWAMASVGGTNICLRSVSAKSISEAIFAHKVTHLCGAPVLLNLIADAPPSFFKLPSQVRIVIAGALPPRQVVERVENLGFVVTHAYGMTEALGPVVYKAVTFESKIDVQSKKLNNKKPVLGEVSNNPVIDVRDTNTLESVPCDGKTIGEVMLKGNTLMMGYFKNPKATQEAFRGGWYRTGDLGVLASDGSVIMLDRKKDAIFCGKQIISTLEIEEVLVSHPMALEAAVVGGPGETFEQRPFAFVKLKFGCVVSAEEIISFCVQRLPNIMVPRAVFFRNLPVNSTGKVQKFVLRKKLESLNTPAASSITSSFAAEMSINII